MNYFRNLISDGQMKKAMLMFLLHPPEVSVETHCNQLENAQESQISHTDNMSDCEITLTLFFLAVNVNSKTKIDTFMIEMYIYLLCCFSFNLQRKLHPQGIHFQFMVNVTLFHISFYFPFVLNMLICPTKF